MKTKCTKKTNRVIAWLLALAMIVSVVTGSPTMTALAATADELQEDTNYIIVSKSSGKAMTVEENSADNNASICQMPIGNYASQVWTLDYADGYYQIINNFSGKSLRVPESSKEAGKEIVQYDIEDTDNSKWEIADVNGYYKIAPKISQDFGLNVEGGSNEDGAHIIQWTFDGFDNELWEFRKVDKVVKNPEPEPAEARKAFDAYVDKFVEDKGDYSQLTNIAGFWAEAEATEMFIDAYERFGDEETKNLMIELVDGWIEEHGTYWEGNSYNDDIMWAVIMCARTYLHTGNQKYLNIARTNFDMCYGRAWTTDTLGGGLVWNQNEKTKNACVNGPGAIAACYLAKATGDNTYYEKAKGIVDWMNEVLVQQDGSVWDCKNWETNDINKWVSTYNQGTYIGACTMLYEYYNDPEYFYRANRAAGRAVELGKILNGEQGNADLIGFKGILARWMGYFALNYKVTDYNNWMQNNADSAWTNRNSDNLMWTQFGAQTVEELENCQEEIDGGANEMDDRKIGDYASWGSSAPLSWLINCSDMEKRQNEDNEPEYSLFPLEAELGKTNGGALVNMKNAASNGAVVGNISSSNEGKVSIQVNAESAGIRTLKVYFVTAVGRQLNIVVNGTVAGAFPCDGTSWDVPNETPVTTKVILQQGMNTILFEGIEDYAPDIDKIEIELTAAEAAATVVTMIDTLPETITKDNAIVVKAVQEAYNALDNKDAVTNAEKLETAKDKVEEIENPQPPVVENVKVTNIEITGTSTKMKVGEELDLEVNVSPENATNPGVTWTSSNESYAEVNENGVVTAREAGAGNTVTITATAEDGSGVTGIYTIAIETENPQPPIDETVKVTNIEITGTSTKMKVGEKLDLEVNVLPENATNLGVTWTSSNETYAEVNENGVVTAREAGAGNTVTITATAKDGSGVTETYIIAIEANAGNDSGEGENKEVKVQSIKISGISKKIAAGKKIKLTVNVEPKTATVKSVTWTSSNSKYAKVDANGRVTVKKAGKNKKVTITATANDGSGVKAYYVIKIMPEAVKKIVIKAESKTVRAGKKLNLKAIVTPNLSKKKINKDVVWTSSNPKYATVTSKGVVKTTKAGKGKKVKITAKATDGSGKKKTITIKIK